MTQDEMKRVRIFHEVEDVYDLQRLRIARRFATVDRRREQRRLRSDTGPLIQANDGTMCPAGDELDVRDKNA